MKSGRPTVLVVGQTPPPHGGQARMIQLMLDHEYKDVNLVHVRMAFSEDLSDTGKFRLHKLLHLGSVVGKIARARVTARASVLYYPPAGPKRTPIARDMAILLATRWMFQRTVFHFHATGLSTVYPGLPRVARWAFRLAYFRPDLAIQTSEYNYPDGEALQAKHVAIVPNCVELPPPAEPARLDPGDHAFRILFVGLLTRSKGVEEIIEVGGLLLTRQVSFEIKLVGEAESPEYLAELMEQARVLGVHDRITFTGVLTGEALEAAYQQADVFMFPTHGRTESFGLVLLEAMARGVPVVGSGLGGVQSIIRDGVNGFLVEPLDVRGLANAVERLARDSALRRRMGLTGERDVRSNYTPAIFWGRINREFLRVTGQIDH